MKKFWLFATLWLATFALTGCNCDCNCETTQDEDAVLNQRIEYCNAHWGTHSFIHSPTAAYWECAFPSGVTCDDTTLWTDECNFEPNLDSIDTEEKRLAGCEENVQWWMTDMANWAENVDIQWGEESEGWASFVRNWVIKYTKEWINYTMDVECVADFVDGSLWVSYGDEIAENANEVSEGENVEENAEQNIEENVEENTEQNVEESVE